MNMNLSGYIASTNPLPPTRVPKTWSSDRANQRLRDASAGGACSKSVVVCTFLISAQHPPDYCFDVHNMGSTWATWTHLAPICTQQTAPSCAMLDVTWTYMCMTWLQLGAHLGRLAQRVTNWLQLGAWWVQRAPFLGAAWFPTFRWGFVLGQCSPTLGMCWAQLGTLVRHPTSPATIFLNFKKLSLTRTISLLAPSSQPFIKSGCGRCSSNKYTECGAPTRQLASIPISVTRSDSDFMAVASGLQSEVAWREVLIDSISGYIKVYLLQKVSTTSYAGYADRYGSL